MQTAPSWRLSPRGFNSASLRGCSRSDAGCSEEQDAPRDVGHRAGALSRLDEADTPAALSPASSVDSAQRSYETADGLFMSPFPCVARAPAGALGVWTKG